MHSQQQTDSNWLPHGCKLALWWEQVSWLRQPKDSGKVQYNIYTSECPIRWHLCECVWVFGRVFWWYGSRDSLLIFSSVDHYLCTCGCGVSTQLVSERVNMIVLREIVFIFIFFVCIVFALIFGFCRQLRYSMILNWWQLNQYTLKSHRTLVNFHAFYACTISLESIII